MPRHDGRGVRLRSGSGTARQRHDARTAGKAFRATFNPMQFIAGRAAEVRTTWVQTFERPQVGASGIDNGVAGAGGFGIVDAVVEEGMHDNVSGKGALVWVRPLNAGGLMAGRLFGRALKLLLAWVAVNTPSGTLRINLCSRAGVCECGKTVTLRPCELMKTSPSMAETDVEMPCSRKVNANRPAKESAAARKSPASGAV